MRGRYSFKKIRDKLRKEHPNTVVTNREIKDFVNTLNNLSSVSNSEEEWQQTIDDAFELASKAEDERINRES